MNITYQQLRTSLFIFLVFIGLLLNAQTPSLVWTKAINSQSNNNSRGYDLAIDQNGNVFITGTFNGLSDFCPGPCNYTLNTGAFQNIFIAKYDSLGSFLWVKEIGSAPLGEQVNSIAIDNQNNIIIGGHFADFTDFDPGPGTSYLNSNPGSGGDAFMLKLDNDGNFMWAKSFGGMFHDEIKAIKCNSTGEIIVGGNFIDTVDFDPSVTSFTLNANSTNDSFLAKFDANGNLIWAKQFIGNNLLASFTLDNNDNIISTGSIFFTSDFNPGSSTFNLGPPTSTNFGLYVVKLDYNGDFLWANGTFAANENIAGRAVKTDLNGNVYCTGYFSGVPDFDPSASTYTLPATSFQRSYILKYNNTGNFQWVKTINGTAGHNWGNSVDIDAQNNPVVAGHYSNYTDFDPGPGTYTLPAVTAIDMPSYVINLSPAGNLNYVYQISSNSWPHAVKCSTANIVYTTGYYTAPGDFDPGLTNYTMSLTGSLDVFMHKMGPNCPSPLPPSNITPNNLLTICSGNTTTLSASSSGIIKWYTSSTSYSNIGIGSNYITPTLATGTYTYFAESNTCQTNENRTAIIVNVSSCTGIEEFAFSEHFQLYPNPFQRELIIESDISDTLIDKINIYNNLGQTVSFIADKTNSQKILITLEEKGLFHLKIRLINGEIISKRIFSN